MHFTSTTVFRVVGGLVGFFGIVLGAPWIVLIMMVALALRFRAWEILAMGIGMDFVWLPAGFYLFPLPLFTIGALLLVWGLEPLRNEILV